MRINRRLLYTGVFLLALGAVLVTADLAALNAAVLGDVLRLWPVALIAIGAGLALRRTQFGVPGGLLAVALPGVLVGSALAVAPRFAEDCGARNEPVPVAAQQGVFSGPARVDIRSGCGILRVQTRPGSTWTLDARNSAGRAPVVEATGIALVVDARYEDGLDALDDGRDDWTVSLPARHLAEVAVLVSTGHGDVRLPGARVGRLMVTANAAHLVVDAGRSVVDALDGAVNVGALEITLPDADLTGSLRVNAGELRLCTPPGLGLRLTTRGSPREVEIAGVEVHETGYQSPGYASAVHHADLQVSVKFGAVKINPIGGCK